MLDRLARVVGGIGGFFLAGFGLWAVVDPRGFYDAVATWPPYNVHLLHDIGAFQIGLGIALLLALLRSDALFVGLTSAGVGQSVHSVVHFVDRGMGGKATDPLVMSSLAVLLIVGAWSRSRVLLRG